MYLGNKLALVGGVAWILFSLLVLAFVGLQAGTAATDPLPRSNAAQYLLDVQVNSNSLRLAFALGVVIDAIVLPIAAAATYLLLRDRSRLLALLALVGFVANSALSGTSDGFGIALTFVADDFARGGPAGLAARDPATLEIGRVIAVTQRLMTHIQVTVFGLAEISLGALLAFAPVRTINPPRTLGWISIASGIAAILAWGSVGAESFVVFLVLNSLGTLIVCSWLGVWLIGNRRSSAPLRRVEHADVGSARGGD